MDDCKMNNAMYSKVKKKLYQMIVSKYPLKDILACIYDLFQEYLISEEQETELYTIADPKETFNDVADYYFDEFNGENPLKEAIGY